MPDTEQRLQEIEQRLAIARKLGDDEDGPNWYARDVGWLVEENHRLREALLMCKRRVQRLDELGVTRSDNWLAAIDAALGGEQP